MNFSRRLNRCFSWWFSRQPQEKLAFPDGLGQNVVRCVHLFSIVLLATFGKSMLFWTANFSRRVLGSRPKNKPSHDSFTGSPPERSTYPHGLKASGNILLPDGSIRLSRKPFQAPDGQCVDFHHPIVVKGFFDDFFRIFPVVLATGENYFCCSDVKLYDD